MGNFFPVKVPGAVAMQAEVLTVRRQYQAAFDMALKAYALKKEEQITLSRQMQDLLYAYTESEFNKNRLIVSEEEKQQKTIWIMVISFAAVIVILLILKVLQRTRRKLKADIAIRNPRICQ